MIVVNAYKNKDYICIEIKDNGIGMSKEMLEEINQNIMNKVHCEHYGLYNINERLSVKYNDKHKFIIESEINIGTKITISYPIN